MCFINKLFSSSPMFFCQFASICVLQHNCIIYHSSWRWRKTSASLSINTHIIIYSYFVTWRRKKVKKVKQCFLKSFLQHIHLTYVISINKYFVRFSIPTKIHLIATYHFLNSEVFVKSLLSWHNIVFVISTLHFSQTFLYTHETSTCHLWYSTQQMCQEEHCPILLYINPINVNLTSVPTWLLTILHILHGRSNTNIFKTFLAKKIFRIYHTWTMSPLEINKHLVIFTAPKITSFFWWLHISNNTDFTLNFMRFNRYDSMNLGYK